MQSSSPSDSFSRPRPGHSAAPGRPTLLVVDDEEGPRQSLRFVFKDDYDLLLAESGEQALDIARQRHIDAAVVDIRMAGMTGTELLARLKEMDPSIQVIMLTAYETVDTARQAMRYGACDYQTKPFDISTMRAAVANALRRHSLTKELQANSQRLMELEQALQAAGTPALPGTTPESGLAAELYGPLTILSGFLELITRQVGAANHLEGAELNLVRDRVAKLVSELTNCIEIVQRHVLPAPRSHPGPGLRGEASWLPTRPDPDAPRSRG